MAQNRGRQPARRNYNNNRNAGMPGWAWLLIGALIAALLFLFVPRFMNKDEGGFFKPQPNPDAQPISSSGDEAEMTPDAQATAKKTAADKNAADNNYSFYDMLPGDEVKLTDAQLAAMAKAEKEKTDASAANADAAAADTGAAALPEPIDTTTASTTPASAPTVPAAKPATATEKPKTTEVAKATTAKTVSPNASTPYILQAGAFGQASQADELKAKVALLGLNARVEEATINGKTMFRVRMGPNATASELSAAKTKLGNGGLSAIPIKAK